MAETHDKRTETHACDLISRQAMIDAVDGVDWYHQNKNGEMVHGANDNDHQAWYKAEDIYKAVESVPPAQQWIPCSVRCPEKKRKTYWVCTDAEYQCECRWTNNRFGFGESDNWGWSCFDTPQYTEVIAWMPLPEPWKGEQE